MQYNFRNMKCTDPDNLQFGKEEGDGCWYYVQVRDDDILEHFGGYPKKFIDAYEKGTDVAHVTDSNVGVYAGDVDFDDFTAEEIEEYIKPYGYTMKTESPNSVQELYGKSWKQICCECIFEQLMLTDYCLDY